MNERVKSSLLFMAVAVVVAVLAGFTAPESASAKEAHDKAAGAAPR